MLHVAILCLEHIYIENIVFIIIYSKEYRRCVKATSLRNFPEQFYALRGTRTMCLSVIDTYCTESFFRVQIKKELVDL